MQLRVRRANHAAQARVEGVGSRGALVGVVGFRGVHPVPVVGVRGGPSADASGVVGWGVGGIEAEAVMLGQPIYMLLPDVIGFRLEGKLPVGTTATDLVLTVTQMLRAHGVVGKFVEFCKFEGEFEICSHFLRKL